jgi:Domain of unknown function (DUF4188)
MASTTRGKQVALDLAGYPGLVVIYLGMRVNTLRGLKTLVGFGPRIKASVRAQPDGLLLHEDILWGMFPPHVGMRQYWRDFDALERWARTDPHAQWWQAFIKDRGGTGFWHETYLAGGVSRRATWTCPRTSGCPSSPLTLPSGARCSRLGDGWAYQVRKPTQARSRSRSTTPTSPVRVGRPPGSLTNPSTP